MYTVNRHTRSHRLLYLLLISVLLSACAKKTEAPLPPRPVRTLIVSDSTGGTSATYTAEIRSRYETDLSFQVGGKVISRSVDVGVTVKRGQMLAQLDPTDEATHVDATRAAVTAAQAELDRARTEEARYRDLLERGLTTRAAYLAQQTQVKTTQSRLDQANADLKLGLQRVGYASLRADQDGVITKVMIEVGAVIGAGQKAISLARPSELEAVFDVPDAYIDEVRHTTTATMSLLNDSSQQYAARIREISPSADPVTRTYQVKATLPKPPASLHLGMTVAMKLPLSTSKALALPATALTQQGHEAAVWIVNSAHRLELRPVQVERYESDRVMIAGGLNAGERVVTAGVHRLAAQEEVRLLEEIAQ